MTKAQGNHGWAAAIGAAILIMLSAVAAPAQDTVTFATLHSFQNEDGANPYSALVQGTDGHLYGTTVHGGDNGYGTIFKISTTGRLTTIYRFCSLGGCADGANPFGGLILASDGNFYGTTSSGGAYGVCGTVFKITPSGTLTTLHNFDCIDGSDPYGALVQGTDGDFYGTTVSGGGYGYGTVFKISVGGALTTLHSFDSVDGADPYAGLVEGTDGNFYGTTTFGGYFGTIFKMTPAGNLTTLYSFTGGNDGEDPVAPLIQAADGDFYGTTPSSGTSNGTIFKITTGGMLSTVYDFKIGGDNGGLPQGGLIQATDGNFYGTTAFNGSGTCNLGCGTVFEVTPGGTLTTLHTFNVTNGATPDAGLLQDTNGNLYGATFAGGAGGYGTIFELKVGLGPFVETAPEFGKVKASVSILGSDLTGSTSVTFNGTSATFRVISGARIFATVPVGATTGLVQVVTPNGTLTSDVNFQVLP
ncbi:MAG TPA: choice-of-anchor tandem repeat GloVer-containing protein [Terriglobia bacterium]